MTTSRYLKSSLIETNPQDENSINKEEKAALTIQRQWRSETRYRLHTKIFEKPPQTNTTQAGTVDRFLEGSGLDKTAFKQLYYQLSCHPTIINSKVYH